MKQWLAAAKQLLQEYGNDGVSQLSAAFSYGAIFSLGPLLLVLISVAGFVLGPQAAQGKLFTELSGVVGASTAHTIQNVVAHTHQSGRGTVALVVGIAGTLLGAAGITSQLQNSFNTIFAIVPDPAGGLKRTVYVKLKNVLLVLLGGLVVVASIAASTLVIGLGRQLQQHFGLPAIGLEAVNSLVSLAVFTLTLYLLYRTLPDVGIPRNVVMVTALVVSLLFLAGKIALSLIIGRNGTASAYGAAAALVSLLLWIYYSGLLLFIGTEGMKIYGYNHSLSYPPKRFNLKRATVHVDSSDLTGRLVESWLRGFRKRSAK